MTELGSCEIIQNVPGMWNLDFQWRAAKIIYKLGFPLNFPLAFPQIFSEFCDEFIVNFPARRTSAAATSTPSLKRESSSIERLFLLLFLYT